MTSRDDDHDDDPFPGGAPSSVSVSFCSVLLRFAAVLLSSVLILFGAVLLRSVLIRCLFVAFCFSWGAF